MEYIVDRFVNVYRFIYAGRICNNLGRFYSNTWTGDPELDNIILDLDRALDEAGVPDDKKYSNSRYFFSNITLARFNTALTDRFLRQVKELSQSISFEPYIVDTVTLLTCNAVFMNKNIIKTWTLK